MNRDANHLANSADRTGWSKYAKATGLALTCAAGLSQVCSISAAEPNQESHWPRWLKLSRVPQRSEVPTKPKPTANITATPKATPQHHEPQLPLAASAPEAHETTPIQTVSADIAADAPAAIAPIPVTVPPTPEEARAQADMLGMTLEMLVALADAHHPRLTAAYQQIQAAQGRAVQAGLYPNPVVATSSPQWDGNESQFNGFVSQEIVTAKKLKLDVAAIQREVSQAQFAWQQERFGILTALRQQYYSTLAAQSRVAVLTSLVQIAHHSRDVSRKLLDAGEGTRGDTLLFDIEVDRAEVALANAETVYRVGRRQLAILAAVPDMEIDRLAGDLDQKLQDYDLQELRFAIAAVNPQANIARLEIDRNSYRLRRAVVQPIPNIDIMGGYQRQVGVPQEDQGLFQVTMTVPLWNKNQGNIFAAEAELAGARADLNRVELDLGNQAADALQVYQTAGQLVDRYEVQILPKARETLNLTQQLYAQGQIDFLRLLQSQKTLLEAELARLEALEQRWISAAMIAGLLQTEHFP
ncbi:hypothetical protein GC163_18940 [bacterium]|nr:hypothetical protein [bacterium]